MRSITYKLILSFVSVGLISIALIVLLARWNTRAEFIKFISAQEQADVAAALMDYYVIHGSWDGVTDKVILPLRVIPPEVVQAGQPPFTITSQSGTVLASNSVYAIGQQVPDAELDHGLPIQVDGRTVGVLVLTRAPFENPVLEERPLEAGFIRQINLNLLYSALAASIVAFMLGIWISRTVTRPIRELTVATRAISEGSLWQQVPVRSRDELGRLAVAFNAMSAELARSVDARRQMTADIAHELRTPLSVILGHAEAVHDGVLDPTRENFEIVRDEAGRLEQLVEDLRTLSLADAGELTLNPEQASAHSLLQTAAARYQHELTRNHISVEFDAPSDLPLITADKARIGQVLTNVLDNAVRHSPNGERILLKARRSEDTGWIELSVEDRGPGVSADDLERIFDRFYRTDPSRQRIDGGSGLGLAIARSIVQAHGGQISAEIRADGGLRLAFTLPIAQSDRPA